jgi:hypothetical protein
MNVQALTVPFHGTELFIVEHNGQPYTPMKPIVEGMGLDWKSQFDKIKQRFASTVVEITIVAGDGKNRLMTCLPLRKLAGWLYTISASMAFSPTIRAWSTACEILPRSASTGILIVMGCAVRVMGRLWIHDRRARIWVG